MRILISNDDGIDAVGLRCLQRALSKEHDILVAAPLKEKSASGHALTLGREVKVYKHAKNVFALDGFPADCVLMGYLHLFKDQQIDLVVSGINRGGNLGQDIYYSGTVAAAREAVFRNIPGIAISVVTENEHADPDKFHCQTAADLLCNMLRRDIQKLLTPFTLLNINLPNLASDKITGAEITSMGIRHYHGRVACRRNLLGRAHLRYVGGERSFEPISGSDCLAIDQNKISLTPLNLLLHPADNIDVWKMWLDKTRD